MGVGAYHYNHLDLAMGRCIVGGRSSGPVGRRRAVGMKVRRLPAGRKGSLVHICNNYISILLVWWIRTRCLRSQTQLRSWSRAGGWRKLTRTAT
jgi:hypothetical protein